MTAFESNDSLLPLSWPSEGLAESVVNILIVDDKPANIVSLEAILARPGYNLVSATSGMEALRHVLKCDFAVILLDVMMPEMDGFEFARLVKKRMRSTQTPIIFLTAIATDFRYLQEGYEVGAVDYLQKPLDSFIVRAKVSVFVELFRKNERIREQEKCLREIQRAEQARQLDEIKCANERHYRSLADALPQIIFTADALGEICYFNKKWGQYTGLPEALALDEVARRGLIHPDDLQTFEDSWQAARQHGSCAEVEVRFKEQATGNFRWHLCRSVPERNLPGNDVVGWVGTITDIHGQKRAEHAQRFLAEASSLLSSSLDYHHTLTELCEKFVGVCGNGCIVSLKLSGTREFEYSAGCASSSDFSWETLPENRKIAAAVHLRGQLAGHITCVSSPNCEPLDKIDTDLLLETCRHLMLSLENSLLYEEAQEANRQKEEFLAILSHELRTPLNAVLGWTSIVKQDVSEPRTLQGLEVVESNAKLLSQLVADLLDVSRIVTGKLALNRGCVDLHCLIQDLLATVNPFAREKQIDLKFDASTQIKPSIWGDPSRIQQIFWNLLTNAIKFTPENGKVQVVLKQEKNCAVVDVLDSGLGISSELLPVVFDRFRQADSSSTRSHGGLGLGLAIVKHLTELHGGSVNAQSAGLGRGATFTLKFPLFDAATERLGAATGERKSLALANKQLENRSAVLVDDDPSSRMLVAIFLRQAGAEVRTAGSVAEALQLVQARRPDFVLTDIGMPGEDGYDLLRQLTAVTKAQNSKPLCTVALTAYASAEDSARATAAGFSLYLTKPIEAATLTFAVSQLLKRSETPQPAHFQSESPEIFVEGPIR